MNDLLHHLQQSSTFRQLPPKEIDLLVRQAIPKKLRAGDYLCHQGDVWQYTVLLGKGELRWAMISVGGREQVLFRVLPGHVFWAHSMFDGQPMPASLQAAKTSQVYLWSKEMIAPLLTRNPAVMWEILGRMTAIMRQAREVIYGLAFKPVAGRLAKLLLEQAAGQAGQPIQRELTLNEIAATIATSQEVVCRLLYQFQSDKLIELDRACFRLSDTAGLEQLVEKP
jgi:CRP-like cAMP-binding protein